MYGSFRAPSLRPGRDVAGDVETVGKNVTRFKPGDAVFGFCRGGLAEYACMPETRIVHKPQNVTYEQGACVPVAGITALQALRDHGQLQAGQSVLINGAAGGVGTFAVQIAKTMGASVTAVCSERNATLLTSLGADRVVDYVRTDFTTASTRYDLIIDNVANHPLSAYRRVLARRGRCAIVGPPKRLSIWLSPVFCRAEAPFTHGAADVCHLHHQGERSGSAHHRGLDGGRKGSAGDRFDLFFR